MSGTSGVLAFAAAGYWLAAHLVSIPFPNESVRNDRRRMQRDEQTIRQLA
jgi:hypothetical protein